MKQVGFVLSFVLLSILSNAQEKDFSLAKVGKKVLGVYIFIGCEPANEYDYIATINVKWHKDPEEYDKALLELIERSKKKYPNFNGMIFKNYAYQTADIIKFRELEITGGGFRVGDNGIYKDGSKMIYGEIVSLNNVKQEANFKYYNEYGDEKYKTIDYVKLSPISSDQYKIFRTRELQEIEKHKFIIGEKVSWSEGRTLKYGEITSLNPKSHDATVKFLNIYGEDKTTIIDFLKLDKVDESKYKEINSKEIEEIKKHQFAIGQKVSFVKDKKSKSGEIVGLNTQNHKATIKYLNIFGEDKTFEENFLEIEKIPEDQYSNDIEKYKIEALKYKFSIGEKVIWTKEGFLSVTNEGIPAEITGLDDIEHKALIKYINKDGEEKQEKVSYLSLTKTK